MLEALVNLARRSGVGAANSQPNLIYGEVIVVKKAPAVWGRDEKQFFMVTYIQDDDLEATLDSGVLAYPYPGKVVDMTQFTVPTTAISNKPQHPKGKDHLTPADLF